jgi:hypothetical protein
MIKTALIAAGGLLAAKGMAAETEKTKVITSFAGNWLYEGQPCAIFQQGSILLVVNESGALATAHVTGRDSFVIWSGSGWDSGLVARLAENTRLEWSNNSVWTMAAD